MSRQLAIIKNAGVMYEDHYGETCLSFDSYISEAGAALQLVRVSDPLFPAFWEAMSGNVKNLEGKTVWVEVDGSFIRLAGFANI